MAAISTNLQYTTTPDPVEPVKFHDGSDFNADAVIWNWDKIRNKEAPQYDTKQASEVGARITAIKSYKKIDDYTVEFLTT